MTSTIVFACITNIAVCAAVAVAVVVTNSAWPLLGLMFLASVTRINDEESGT